MWIQFKPKASKIRKLSKIKYLNYKNKAEKSSDFKISLSSQKKESDSMFLQTRVRLIDIALTIIILLLINRLR